MIQPLDERTPPMTPQLALRVAIVGTFALVMFAIIFFRLWFLQVLSGDQYVAAAQGNIVRTIPVGAPRGDILSSNGTVLVNSAPVPSVEIAPPDLPVPVTLSNMADQPPQDYAIYDRLAKVLGISTKPQPCQYYTYPGAVEHNVSLALIPCLIVQGISNAAFANVTIKSDVSADVQAYLAERQTEFPGVRTQEVYLTQYPHDELAAQVLGTVGAVQLPELKQANFKGAKAGDVVGQSGLEYHYNLALAGTDGDEAIKVNSADQFEGYAKGTKPISGNNLKTSLDLNLEQVGDAALRQSIASNPPADSGAFLAMDPQNGQIYAMGSLPSYDPSIFTQPISQTTYDQDFGANSGDPLINRAIDSPLPDGSTFKVITATAALETGAYSAGDVYDDIGEFCFPGTTPSFCLHNSDDASYGAVNLEQAIEVSDDVYFYHLGYLLQFNPLTFPNGGPLQKWAREYGIGQTTGVDLPDEANGVLPTPNYVTARWKEEMECEHATGAYAYTDSATGQISSKKLPGYHRSPKYPAVISDETVISGGCGIAAAGYWSVGDNVESGVGQGDDLVTPMQLAVVYAAIENGGTIVTPHIGEDIQSPSGTIIQNIDPAPKSTLNIQPAYLDAIRTGLNMAAQGSQGTSDDVMGDFPEPVYGKTGTAVLSKGLDDAWYVAYVPSKTKPIVVVVNVEKGGYGDVAAAPVARELLSQWFLGRPGSYRAGSSAGDQT